MKIFIYAIAFLALSFPSVAAPSCYSPAEMQAEQLLRLHSELMVITVTCRTSSGGASLTPSYTGFTNAHIAELHNAESAIKAYYNAHGGNGEARLDIMRTKMGNEYGRKIAKMSSPAFCDAYRDKVVEFESASDADIVSEVRRKQASEPSYQKLCKL